MEVFINLYQPLHPKTTERFSAKNIFIVYGIFIFSLCAVYGYGALEKEEASLNLEKAEKQRAQTEKELAKVQQVYSSGTALVELTSQLNTLERELEDSKQALQLFSGKTLTNIQGFSQYLVAIAKQSREGLWLESIKLSEGGEQIELKGKTRQPEFLFQYVQRLGSEPSLKEKAINAFSLSKTSDSENVLQFFLGTVEEGKKEETSGETSK